MFHKCNHNYPHAILHNRHHHFDRVPLDCNLIYYYHNRPSCVNWKTISTSIKVLSTVNSTIKPNWMTATISHVTAWQNVHISVCSSISSLCVVDLTTSYRLFCFNFIMVNMSYTNETASNYLYWSNRYRNQYYTLPTAQECWNNEDRDTVSWNLSWR